MEKKFVTSFIANWSACFEESCSEIEITRDFVVGFEFYHFEVSFWLWVSCKIRVRNIVGNVSCITGEGGDTFLWQEKKKKKQKKDRLRFWVQFLELYFLLYFSLQRCRFLSGDPWFFLVPVTGFCSNCTRCYEHLV